MTSGGRRRTDSRRIRDREDWEVPDMELTITEVFAENL